MGIRSPAGAVGGRGREARRGRRRCRHRHAVLSAAVRGAGTARTGKTEISSQAVHAQLWADPRARILVSAQSHFALDNLAVKILS